MIESELSKLGSIITRLRIAKNLKQSELAYEAGISERTLQRMEAGEVVKSDGLLKIVAYLGKLDELLAAIDVPQLSPYELARRRERREKYGIQEGRGEIKERKSQRARVRTSKHSTAEQGQRIPTSANSPSDIVWPEDQK